MKQELYINGEVVGYTLLTKNITGVMGKAYIYKSPTINEVLRIVFRGLDRTLGLTESEFISGFGTVYMRKKGQYTVWMIYGLLRGRINQINKEYERH